MKRLMTTVFAVGCLAAVAAETPAASAPAKDSFAVGYHRIDITPPLGVPLSGYYHRRLMTGILDPLHATCLAFSDGTHRAAVVAVDNLQIADSVIAQLTGCWGSFFVMCTGRPFSFLVSIISIVSNSLTITPVRSSIPKYTGKRFLFQTGYCPH